MLIIHTHIYMLVKKVFGNYVADVYDEAMFNLFGLSVY